MRCLVQVFLVALVALHPAAAFTPVRLPRFRPLTTASSRSAATTMAATSRGPALALAAILAAAPITANAGELIGSIPASGFIFKDTLDVSVFKDPKVTGVSLYGEPSESSKLYPWTLDTPHTNLPTTLRTRPRHPVVSDFSKPITEKLASGDLFTDPSTASITCAKDGPVKVMEGTDMSKSGEEVFSEVRCVCRPKVPMYPSCF